MGAFFKFIGKAVAKAVKSKTFREFVLPILIHEIRKKVEDDDADPD